MSFKRLHQGFTTFLACDFTSTSQIRIHIQYFTREQGGEKNPETSWH